MRSCWRPSCRGCWPSYRRRRIRTWRSTTWSAMRRSSTGRCYLGRWPRTRGRFRCALSPVAAGRSAPTRSGGAGAPRDVQGDETGLAVIGMGKLGGEELNYSSDIDLMFVYGADGNTAGGPEGRLANGEYFARVCRDIVSIIEAVTEEGYVFRVDLRLRPEGRMGAVALSLDAFRTYHHERAELWE